MPRTRAEETQEDEALRTAIGARLRQARLLREHTHRTLAQAIGYEQNHLSRIERGNSWPSVPILLAMCRELDMSADWLLFEKGPAPKVGDRPARRLFEVVHSTAPVAERKPPVNKQALPEAVTAFLAFESSSVKPETIDRLRRFDYAGLGYDRLTPQQVRNLAAELDSEEERGDDQ